MNIPPWIPVATFCVSIIAVLVTLLVWYWNIRNAKRQRADQAKRDERARLVARPKFEWDHQLHTVEEASILFGSTAKIFELNASPTGPHQEIDLRIESDRDRFRLVYKHPACLKIAYRLQYLTARGDLESQSFSWEVGSERPVAISDAP